jgi:hypothetical protein
VGVITVATLVAVNEILGINNPSSVETTSNEPLGDVVPIPTCAVKLQVKNKRKVENKYNFIIVIL